MLWQTLATARIVWLADASSSSPDLMQIGQFGAVGAIAVMLIVFAKGAHKRETDNGDRLREENAKLNQTIQDIYADMRDRVIPALTAATIAMQQCTELLTAVQRERELALTKEIAKARGRTHGSA